MPNDEADQQRWENLYMEAGRAFSPNTPIDERALFAGRRAQLWRLVDAINQPGQHAIIYGERGVGKTSLANVLKQFVEAQGVAVIAPRVNCDSSDTFATAWRKVFRQIEVIQSVPAVGFQVGGVALSTSFVFDATGLFGKEGVNPDSVRLALANVSANALPILILDEFDRLPRKPRRAFADTIKNLSDHAVPATVVLVGVADSVEQLIEEHQSVERAVVQVQLPRMDPAEIKHIIETGVASLKMTIEADATERISLLAQGLPHYAHLLGLYASRTAIDSRSIAVSLEVVEAAIRQAIAGAQQTIQTAYHTAIRSARKDNLFADVLLSCALADCDEIGFFASQDVRPPLREITGKPYDIPAFAQHLKEFTEPKRGKVLRKIGERRRFRYRFADPLMQPFVIMHGVVERKVGPGLFRPRGTRAAPSP